MDTDSDIDMVMSNDIIADASDNNNILVQQNFETVNANSINLEIHQTLNTALNAAASLNLERQTKRKTSYVLMDQENVRT